MLLASVLIIACVEVISAQNCAPNTGRRQSPIDIKTKDTLPYIYPPLKWSAGYNQTAIKMELINFQGSLQLNVVPSSPLILKAPLAPVSYEFLQIHFHWGQDKTGGEHYVNNEYYPMEMHAVHTQSVSNTADQFLVVGYLFNVSRETNVPLQNILDSAVLATTNKTANVKPFKLHDLLYKTPFSYYTYEGSLTTPPYTESVNWIVAADVFPITQRQLDVFRKTLTLEPTFRNNYRCTQELYKRKVIFALQ